MVVILKQDWMQVFGLLGSLVYVDLKYSSAKDS